MASQRKRKRSSSVLWSQLPIDVLNNIIRRLDSPIDAISFSGVCMPWRHVALGMHMSLHCKLPIYHAVPKRSPLPMLLHPGCEGPDTHQLYSLNERKIYGGFHLQELSNKCIVGSGAGWLVTIDPVDATVALLNPLNGKKIPLPPLSTLPCCDLTPDDEQTSYDYLRKVIVCSYQGGFLVVALVSHFKAIRFCKIGDSQWTRLENSPMFFDDIIMHNSKLYAVNRYSSLFEIDIAHPAKMTMITVLPVHALCKYFLVSLCDELVLLARFGRKKKSQVTSGFKVFKYVKDRYGSSGDLGMYITETGMKYPGKAGYSLVRLRNLGHHMVFIGYNHSVSVDSRNYPRCKGNCIYFADDRSDEYDYLNKKLYHDVGVYHMAEQKLKHLKQFSKASSPMNMVWLSPNFSSELEMHMLPQ